MLALAGGIWLWRVVFPGDETIIRRRLHELAATASFPANEAPLAKLTNAGKVASFFTVDGEIDIAPWGYQRVVISGRDELRQAALGARNAISSLTVATEGISIALELETDQATARLSLTGRTSENPDRQSQPLELDLRRIDGEWLIRRVKSVEYLTE